MRFTSTFLLGAIPSLSLALALPARDLGPTVSGNGRYIVALKPELNADAVKAHTRWAAGVHARSLSRRQTDAAGTPPTGIDREFGFEGFHAYSGSFEEEAIKEIESSDEVIVVEPDYVTYLQELTTQENAPSYGLDRISHQALNTGTSYNYVYDTSAGQGQTIYVVDSGIYAEHNDFGGRVTLGFNAFNTTHEDTFGHGTHVAGIAAGTQYGVAKSANLVSVKVFVGSQGTLSSVVGGIEWAVNDIISKNQAGTSVINLSLSTPVSEVMRMLVESAYAQDVLSIAASGNSNANATLYSPANVPTAFTVGSSDSADRRSVFSNWGASVDIHAPGTDITSAFIGSPDAAHTESGTSMAAPHVAGLVAYLRALEGSLESPAAAVDRIKQLGQVGILGGDLKGSPNLLINNNSGA